MAILYYKANILSCEKNFQTKNNNEYLSYSMHINRLLYILFNVSGKRMFKLAPLKLNGTTN